MLYFSVIIPSHFRPNLLKKLLISLDEQSIDHDSFEVHIVPSLNDPGIEVALEHEIKAKYSIKVAPIENDPYMGRSAAAKRNCGACRAKGKYLAFIDDDCVAHKDWLLNAKKMLDSTHSPALEGAVALPENSPNTLTAKGMKSLTNKSGYQTCNMIYEKASFFDLGGFDLNFPYYFEDSDLAWTFLESGKEILYCEDALVYHPVYEGDHSKLFDVAKRVQKQVYLQKKHPKKFADHNMKFLSKIQKILLLHLPFFIIPQSRYLAMTSYLIVLSLYQVKLFRGLEFKIKDIVQSFIFTGIVPSMSLFYLIKGKIYYKLFFRQKSK